MHAYITKFEHINCIKWFLKSFVHFVADKV